MHESRADSHSRGKRKHVPTKPKVAPVVVNWVHPAAIAEARHLAFGRDVHIVYDTNEGCMWIRNGAK
jgi:hypothetical protein